MSLRSAGAFLGRLIPAILADLRRIASRSRGETTVEDLKIEAWIVATELSQDRQPPPDADDPAFHQQILGRLYNRFVNFAEKHLQFAVRLDAPREDADGAAHENPVAVALAAAEASDPALALTMHEEARTQSCQLRERFAEAVAYVRVFANIGNDRQAIARHLAIAVCTLRSRLRRAERTVAHQPSLFDGITAIPEDFVPPRGVRKARRKRGRRHATPPRHQGRLFRAYIPLRRL